MRSNIKTSESARIDLFVTPTNLTPEDEFQSSHQLLDIITYSFCTIGLILNFFAFGILRRKATIGVLLIKFILISDGLVCLLYLLNQIWTDIRMHYLSTVISLYSKRKSIPTYISTIFRSLAIATVCVSNWYIVIMIAHRCISIYVSPLRNRVNRSLWVFAQKTANLWIAYASCWLFGILMAFLLSRNNQILLDVFMFVLPLILVFVLSVTLLIKLRRIHRNAKSVNGSTICCFSLNNTNKSHKIDFEETFAQTGHAVVSSERHSSRSEKNQKNRSHKLQTEPFSSNSKAASRSVEIERKKTYYRITMTMLSLALSFLILDSLQMLDLLIRIPWDSLLRGIEQAPKNETGFDKYMTEMQKSWQKQHILSIIKNTCTLGKTLVNFLILCAHSRHFRAIVLIKFKRFRRFFRVVKLRMHPLYSGSVNPRLNRGNLWFISSIGRNTILQKRKGVNNRISLNSPPPAPARKPSQRPKFVIRRPRGFSTPASSLAHSLFCPKRREDEGYVVHKLRKPFRKNEISQGYPFGLAINGGNQVISWNKQTNYFDTTSKKNAMTFERSISNEYFPESARNQLSSSSYQPTANSMVDNIENSESERSYCTTCECKSVNSSSPFASFASIFTYPGALRAHCCDCQVVKFSEASTNSKCCRKK